MTEGVDVQTAESESAPEPEAQNGKRRGCLFWAAIIAGVLVLLLCLLAGWFWVGGQQAKKDLAAQYPPPGQMVDVGDYRLHLNCQGPGPGPGDPTVVIEAGMGDFSVSWGPVQEAVAGFARVCTYDRAGLGWSDTSPNPPTAPYAVADLHALLQAAGVDPPYVLVGHSLGGTYVRLYAHEHPDQVAGLVLVDASYPEEESRFPESYVQAKEQFDQQSVAMLRIPQVLAASGILARSPQDYPSGVLPPLPPGTEETYKAVLALDSSFFDTMLEGYAAYEETKDHMRAAQITTLGDIPLVAITAGKFEVPDTFRLPPEVREQTLAVHAELQAELAALSSNGRRVMAGESGHMVQADQPGLIIDVIRQVVEEAR